MPEAVNPHEKGPESHLTDLASTRSSVSQVLSHLDDGLTAESRPYEVEMRKALESKDFNAVYSHCKKLIQFHPDNYFYRETLVQACMETGRHQEALQTLYQLLDDSFIELRGRTMIILEAVYKRMGRKEAAQEIERLRRLDTSIEERLQTEVQNISEN